jgi:hypothetical protein
MRKGQRSVPEDINCLRRLGAAGDRHGALKKFGFRAQGFFRDG